MRSAKKIILVFIFLAGIARAQQLEAELGYKFNNDFTTYYKDLKPFYYSGATFDLLLKYKDVEYIAGIRYMPYLSAVMPEFGFNYYLNHDPDRKFNYFIHTTFFYNKYSYNNKVGYENYSYRYIGIQPADYTSAKFRSFMHDIALGAKMGLSERWTIDFMAGGGYFYGIRDFAEGIIKDKTKKNYFGVQYNFRFALKYVLTGKKKKSDDE